MSKFIASVCFSLFFSVSLAQEEVQYLIDIDQPTQHMAKVNVRFPASSSSPLEVRLPVWRTGRYQILDLSKGVREFSATDVRGKALSWQMKDKASWLVHNNGQPVIVSYRIYANELGDRTRHIDDSHAFIDPSAVLMYAPELRHLATVVELKVPRKWYSRSGMKSKGRHRFFAENYDQLIDSPIETGIHSFHEFEVGQRQYQVLFWGRGNYDKQKIIDDLTKLDAQVAQIWQTFPYSRYLYMIHATSGPRGATEHINSTVIQRQRDRFASREDYINFILTAAHELVHTWNVKAYRPAGLVPYDFQKENYTPLLWVAEGTTSYFDTLITRRAGIIDQKEFHQELVKSIEAHLNRPGRKVQSVAEASFYQWIESTNHFTINHGVNIYSEGSLISWLLDFEIRNATDDQRSLEDVHRLLYQRFNAKEKGYTDSDLLALVNEVSGRDFNDFWRRYIWGTEAIDFDALLNSAGLNLVRKTEEKQIIDLGWEVDKGLKVTRVLKDSPAWRAGLTVDDILVSLDGLRLTSNNIKQRIEQLKPGESYLLHFFRRDELQSVKVTAQKNPYRKLQIKVKTNVSEQQRRRYKEWTGHELQQVTTLNQEIAN
jgi:predicted metalloprotease with PDZ domain